MPLRVRTTRDRDEYAAAMSAIGHYFGWAATPDDAKGRVGLLPLDRMHAVFDGRDGRGCGRLPFPAHRARRRSPVRRRDRRRRAPVAPAPRAAAPDDGRPAPGQPRAGRGIAALWASEETIYGRFGYGLASLCWTVDADRRDVAVRPELPKRGAVRLVAHDEALETFP